MCLLGVYRCVQVCMRVYRGGLLHRGGVGGGAGGGGGDAANIADAPAGNIIHPVLQMWGGEFNRANMA